MTFTDDLVYGVLLDGECLAKVTPIQPALFATIGESPRIQSEIRHRSFNRDPPHESRESKSRIHHPMSTAVDIQPDDWCEDTHSAAQLVEPMIEDALDAEGLLPLSDAQMAVVLAAVEGAMLAIVIALKNEINKQRQSL